MVSILNCFIPGQQSIPLLSTGGICVDVVRSVDELIAAMSIRSRVFQSEQECPYHEEFDGNDLSGATHLLAKYKGEPIGTMRVRWFADFAKSERFAVIQTKRGGAAAFALIDAACLLAGRKGYTKILGYAQKRVVPFWTRRGGGTVRANRETFSFSDHEYVEIVREIPRPNNQLSIDSPPLVLARPEGDWDRPGVLDRSNERSVRKVVNS